eukprot:tig00000093_g3505.t1
MQAERDCIRELVNPTLKAMSAERGLFFHCADLRWGITEEACQAGEVVLLCLREVQRSTHFVGLLKGRYGWCLRAGAPADDEGDALFRKNLERAAEEFPWVRAWADRSVTEIEIRAGVLGGGDASAPEGAGPPPSRLRAMREKALFYVAGPGPTRETAAAAAGGEGPEAGRRLEALKREVRAAGSGSGLAVAEYQDPRGLALALRDALAAMLERDYPAVKEVPWLELERARHEAFAESRRRVFVRDEGDMAALDAYAAASGPEILVLHGEDGCGKSALLANWAGEWAAGHPGDLTVLHFIGGGSQSSSGVEAIARRVSEEARGRWPEAAAGRGAPELDLRDVKTEWVLAERVRAFLAEGGARWPACLVLVLDGLDELRGEPGGPELGLAWLPPAGPRLRILASTLHDPSDRGPGRDGDGPRPLRVATPTALAASVAMRAATAPDRPHVARAVAPLTQAKRRLLLEGALAEQGRGLSEARLGRLARAPACGSPLFLTVLLEELSNTAVHAALDAAIAALLECGPAPRDLFRLVLRRLAARHGAGPVRDVAVAVACSGGGMEEGELKAFAGVGGGAAGPSEVEWSLLWHDFLPLLVCRDGLFGFFHRCAAEAAELHCGIARVTADPEPDEERPAEFGPGLAPEARRERDAARERREAAARREREAAHARLGDFFAAQPPSQRRAEEAIWALSRSGRACAERLVSVLCDPDVVARLDESALLAQWLRPASGLRHEAAARYAGALRLGSEEADPGALRKAGGVLVGMGLREGVAFLQEALRLRRRKRGAGPGHGELALAMQELAVALLLTGDREAALLQLQEAVRVLEEAVGSEHPETARMVCKLALFHERQDDFAQACTHYEAALGVLEGALGPEHREAREARRDLENARRELARRPRPPGGMRDASAAAVSDREGFGASSAADALTPAASNAPPHEHDLAVPPDHGGDSEEHQGRLLDRSEDPVESEFERQPLLGRPENSNAVESECDGERLQLLPIGRPETESAGPLPFSDADESADPLPFFNDADVDMQQRRRHSADYDPAENDFDDLFS